VSLLHLRRHRAPITATPPTDTITHHTATPPIGTLLTAIRAMDTQPIHNRAMDIRATLDTRFISFHRIMDTQATRRIPLIPVTQTMDTKGMLGIPITQVCRATSTEAGRDIPLSVVHPTTNIQATRVIRLTRVLQAMDFPHTPPMPVPVLEIPSMAIPAITTQRAGRLGLTTLSSLLTEVWPKILLSPEQRWPVARVSAFLKSHCPRNERHSIARLSVTFDHV